MRILSALLKSFSEFIFPSSSVVLALLKLGPDQLLSTLPRSTLDQGSRLALFSYQDPLVKEVIWQIKYKGNLTLAKSVATLLYDVIMDELQERNTFEKHHNVMLLSMPISNERRMMRGWNQAEILAEAIASLDTAGRMKYEPKLLVKVRHTESQTKTTAKRERLANIENSMQVPDYNVVEGQFVVLIDDVTTTGATFKEASRALKEAGVRQVLCIAVAH